MGMSVVGVCLLFESVYCLERCPLSMQSVKCVHGS